jgi:ceramide glucosyltransferase
MLALQILLGACLLFSVVYHVLTVVCACRWRRSAVSPQPAIRNPQSAITILKPLRSTDPEQRASFSTFCLQDYPEYQIVFGALDPADPGLETARNVMRDHPDADIKIVEGGEPFGLNRKVCNLAHMVPHAKHDLLVLSDSDMRVDEDYLRRVAAAFADPAVGLVTCAYRGFAPLGLASTLEALGIGADFIPSVFVAYYLWGVRPAFGSTIALMKQTLAEIGGFEALANELADDYRLAEAVHGLGRKVVLSDYVVNDVLGAESFAVMWSRRLRWAKTSRLMRPGPYTGAFITFTLPLALVFSAAADFSSCSLGCVAAAYAIRCAAAVWITSACTRDPNITRFFPLLPLSDLLGFALWVSSFFGSTIVWRGERFRVGAGGRLVAVTDSPPPSARNSTKTP